MTRKVSTSDFFATHPVFSLDEANVALAPPGGRAGTIERLKHHLATGRLKLATRGVYAVVPPGVDVDTFRPDPFLVAAASRPDAIFSQHSALELLGTAQSLWNLYTVYTERPRRILTMDGLGIRFLDDPKPMRRSNNRRLGTQKAERRGKLLTTTGPERTLIEGFHRPDLAGGLEELMRSASAFAVLDLDRIQEILECYEIANLWAAVGWFLETFQETFHVPETVLSRMERRRPGSPQYLERSRRGGTLKHRWNLIVPERLTPLGET
jgi:predicted transcriptional regulator of viral defense system